MNFSLLSEAWIPVISEGYNQLFSIREALTRPVFDIKAPPMTRLSIIRLLLAIQSYEWTSLSEDKFDIYNGFLQCLIFDEKSATEPREIIDFIDNGSCAYNPELPYIQNNALTAQALLTALCCSRGGFMKGAASGIPRSAEGSEMVGVLISIPTDGTVTGLLKMNALPKSDWVPWWDREISFEEKDLNCPIQRLLWPSRRLQVFDDGKIAVGSGQKRPPKWGKHSWVVDAGRIRYCRKDLSDIADSFAEGIYDISTLVLKMASPLASRNFLYSVNYPNPRLPLVE